jgi:hypothetical protein
MGVELAGGAVAAKAAEENKTKAIKTIKTLFFIEIPPRRKR